MAIFWSASDLCTPFRMPLDPCVPSLTALRRDLTYVHHSVCLLIPVFLQLQLYGGILESFWSSKVLSSIECLVQLLSLFGHISGRRWRYKVLNLMSFSSFIRDIFYSAWYSCSFDFMLCIYLMLISCDILWTLHREFNWHTFQSIFCMRLLILFTLYFISV